MTLNTTALILIIILLCYAIYLLYKLNNSKSNSNNFSDSSIFTSKYGQTYLYLYPLVLMRKTLETSYYSYQSDISETTKYDKKINDFFNRMYNARTPPDASFTAVVNANVDTLYSSSWLELSESHVTLKLPVKDNEIFVLFTAMDLWSNVIWSVELKDTEQTIHFYHSDKPNGSSNDEYVKISTKEMWLLGRTQIVDDINKVHNLQNKYKLLVNDIEQDELGEPISDQQFNPSQIVDNMNSLYFYKYATNIMKEPYQLPKPDNKMKEKLENIGFFSTDFIKYQKTNDSIKKIKVGDLLAKELLNKLSNSGKGGTWAGISQLIGVYGTNYFVRALVAKIGLGANKASDAVYLVWSGLDGNKKYKLEINDFPEVAAFWSITTYNSDVFLVAGELSDGTKELSNINGSLKDSSIANQIKGIKISNGKATFNQKAEELQKLTIILSSEQPTEDCYWLPLQKDQICSLTARCYKPSQDIQDGNWTFPNVIEIQ